MSLQLIGASAPAFSENTYGLPERAKRGLLAQSADGCQRDIRAAVPDLHEPTATTFSQNTQTTFDWNSRQWSVPINAGLMQSVDFQFLPANLKWKFPSSDGYVIT